MASQLTVKVHPLVLMTMVDAYERRSKKTSNDQSLGTLLGFYEKNAIQITDCYAIPFRVSSNGMPEIDDTFNKEMYNSAKKTTPSEQIVGWFFTVTDLPDICEQFHIYYSHVVNAVNVRRDQPPIVLLTLDVNFTEATKGRLPIRAFMRSECGIPKTNNHARIFQPLRVELDSYPGEKVALDLIMKGADSKNREIELDTGLNSISDSVDEMVEWLENTLQYVDKILSTDNLPDDPNIGRKLMKIVDTAATLLPKVKRDDLILNSLRDYMMVSYLSNLTKTQLALEEEMMKN